MAPDSNYLVNPNQDMYQLLAQQNAAARSGGGGGGGEANNDIEVLTKQAALQETAEQQRTTRDRRDMAMSREYAQQDFERGRTESDRQRNLEFEAMQRVAQHQSQLVLDEQSRALELARAGEVSIDELLAFEGKYNQENMEISTKHNNAHASFLAGKVPHQKAFQDRLNQLSLLQDSLGQFQTRLAGTFHGEETIQSLLTDVSRYGPQKIAPFWSIRQAGEKMREWFYSDIIHDSQLEDQLHLGDYKKVGDHPKDGRLNNMLAAAGTYGTQGGQKGAVAKILAQNPGNEPLDRALAPNPRAARAFSEELFSELSTRALSNMGLDINHTQANQLLQNVFSALNDATTSSSMSPKDAGVLITKALTAAASNIFGPAEGAHALPKLVQVIEHTFEVANNIQRGAAAAILNQDKEFDFSSVQNAAVAQGLLPANSLRLALKTATSGQILTVEELTRARGYPSTAYNASTHEYDLGALNIDPNTPEGRLLGTALGSTGVTAIEQLLKGDKADKTAEEAHTRGQVTRATQFEHARATKKAELGKQVSARQAEIIANAIKNKRQP